MSNSAALFRTVQPGAAMRGPIPAASRKQLTKLLRNMMNLLLTCYDPPSIKRNWGEKKCLLVTDLARGSKTVQKPKEVMSACRFELQERGRAFSSRGAHTLSLF